MAFAYFFNRKKVDIIKKAPIVKLMLFKYNYVPSPEIGTQKDCYGKNYSIPSIKISNILIAASLILVPGPNTATAPASNKN